MFDVNRKRILSYLDECYSLPHHAVDLELPAAAVGARHGVQDGAGGKRERGAQHERDGEDRRGKLGDVARVEVLGDDRDASDESERDEDYGHPAEERHGTVVAEQARDGGEHEHAVGVGGKLALRSLGAVAVVDGDVHHAPAAVDGPDRDLGLDLEALRHDGHGLDEGAREGAVAGHDVLEGVAVEDADEPADEVVAEAVEASSVLGAVGAVGDAVAHRHVGLACGDGGDEGGCRLGGIGVVTVDHEVAVGLDVAEHRAHDVALAPARLAAHDGARGGGDGGGAVGGGVVVDVDRGLGKSRAKVPHHLGDGGGLVVAGDEDGHAGAAEGGGGVRLVIGFCGLGGAVGHDSCVPRRRCHSNSMVAVYSRKRGVTAKRKKALISRSVCQRQKHGPALKAAHINLGQTIPLPQGNAKPQNQNHAFLKL